LQCFACSRATLLLGNKIHSPPYGKSHFGG
jgi:hypothetical protein